MDTRVDNIFYFKLAEKLDLQRKKLGYSYRYLAQLTGISRSQLDQYFMGQYRIKKDTYEVICKALGIKPNINVNVEIG